MFGLGMGEIIIILVVALLLLGPQKLPEAAKQLGKGLREFRKATDDLKSQFETELYSNETKPAKPTLVETPAPGSAAGAASEPGSTPPLATAHNVPGLDAALIETEPPPETPPPETQPPLETQPALVRGDVPPSSLVRGDVPSKAS